MHRRAESDPLKDRYVPVIGFNGPAISSVLASPILLRGEAIGALHVESIRKNAFSPAHVAVAEAVAAQVAITLDRAQVVDLASLFSEVDRLIFSEMDSHQVISTALKKVTDALEESERIELAGAQILFPRGRDHLEIIHSTNPDDIGLSVRIDASVCGQAVDRRQTIVLADVTTDPQYRRMLGPSIKSEIAVPVMLGDDGVIIAVLNVESEEADAFQGFNRVLLETFGDKIRTLLAFTKLRSDVTEALELRQASDVLIAVGDQTANLVHKMNNTVGALKFMLLDHIDRYERGALEVDDDYLESLRKMLGLAVESLEIPSAVVNYLQAAGDSVDINRTIENTLDGMEIPETVHVRLELSPEIPRVAVFSFELVVQNLVKNALDAMPNGGLLTVRTFQHFPVGLSSGYVQFSVRDSGPGIADDVRSHMFDLNYSTKKSRGKGLGFGLWWVRTFVKRANGEIYARNHSEGGAEIVVRLPIGEESDTGDSPEEGHP